MSKQFRVRYGEYALVVGASTGIGEAFARDIASKGLGVILVARREDRLAALAVALRDAYQVDTRYIATDLLDDGAIDFIASKTNELNIGLLVVNAAAVLAGGFLTNSAEDEARLIQLNTLVPAKIVHHLGNLMKRRQRGAIILVSSMAAMAPTPFQATYAATKAFVSSFGQALSFELARDGVDVLVVAPGVTETEGLRKTANIDYSRVRGFSPMSADEVARTGLKQLGRRAYFIPGLKNRLTAFIMGMIPKSSQTRMIGKMIAQAVQPKAL